MADALQETIQSMLDEVVAEGSERGVQVAIYQDGAEVVNAFAGTMAPGGNAVTEKTLFPIYSTTKGIMAIMVHLLAQRGQIDYDTPIATYWPEFAAEGKGGITVRHALAHTSGLANMPPGVSERDVYNWDTICAALAARPAVSPPGEKFAYHAVTYGWLLGEIIRRVDGRDVATFLREEITRPLGIEDSLFIGLPADRQGDVAVLQEDPPPTENGLGTTVTPWMFPLGEWMNQAAAREACIPGSNGIASARAVARVYAAVLPGGLDGVELLSSAQLRLATETQTPALGRPEGERRRGLGFILDEAGQPSGFGHGGYGGSWAFGDATYRLAVGVTHNLFSKHDLGGKVVNRLRHAFGIPAPAS
jgi:CubicO group peptidase (beta-lactamase class C family)